MICEKSSNFWNEFMGTLNKNMHKYLKIKLEDFELKKEEVHFLHYICKYEKVEQNELTKHFHVDKSTTTRNIKLLINQGYVIREKDKNDHRKYLLSSTEDGKNLSNEIIKIFKQWHFELTKNLTDGEKEQFRTISKKIISNSNDFLKELS